MTRRRRGRLVAISTALLALAALGAPAQAAAFQVTFAATPDNCVSGTATADFKLQLRDGSTVLDSIATVHPSGSSHRFSDCFQEGQVRSGLTLRAIKSGSASVSFTIPTLTVRTDRATDIVKGKAPANKDVKVRLYDCSRLTFDCVHHGTKTVHVNGSGNYQRDMTSAFNAHGFDQAKVTFTSSAGHSFAVSGTFPWMATALDDQVVFGELNPGATGTFRLREEPGGSVLSTKTKTGNAVSGDYSFTFIESIKPGNQVTGDFASDARLTIPDVSVSSEIVGDDQLLHAVCLPGRKMKIDLNPGVDPIVTADSGGNATINLSTATGIPGFRLTVEQVIITCQSAAGDVVTQRFDPPI